YYVEEYHAQKIDYVVSGLPFASLPFNFSKNILQQTKNILGEEGTFITFQYTKLKQQLFSSFLQTLN
ncbi:SAM-dependent methyltransferase, partial [Bacillus tropicus]